MNKLTATLGNKTLNAFASTFKGAVADLAEVFDEWANEFLVNEAYDQAMAQVEEVGIVAAMTCMGWQVDMDNR